MSSKLLNPKNKCQHLKPQNMKSLRAEDSLEDMLSKQMEFQAKMGNMKKFRRGNMCDRCDFAKLEMANMGIELGELLERLPHKGWKKYPTKSRRGWTSEEQRVETLFEYIDALHFFLNIALIFGFSAEEIYFYFLAKNEENFSRQDRGY